MFIIRNTQTGVTGEPFSGTDIWWLNGDRGYFPEAGMTHGEQKIYAYSVGSFDSRYYDQTGSVLSFNDETNACTKTPTVSLKSVSALRAIRKAELAGLRYEKETGGIVVGFATVATDRESQAMLTGALKALQDGLITAPLDWKSEGGFIQVDEATVSAIAGAVAAHVQACFTNEKTVSASIDACTTEAQVLAVDLNEGW